MAFLNSQDILVFPSTKRGNKQVSARLTSESSIVNIINKLLDTYGFVVTEGDIDFTASSTIPFEFNIFGYYFKVINAYSITSLFSTSSDNSGIYASITLAKSGDYVELQGQDKTTDSIPTDQSIYRYEGVSFYLDTVNINNPASSSSYDANTNTRTYKLLLFKKTNGNWEVLDISRKKFNFEGTTEIDGGEITA